MRRALKAEFDMLDSRRRHKKSSVALAHKVPRIFYAMVSRGSHHQGKTVDCEALSAARGAPRWMKMLRKHAFIETRVTRATALTSHG